MPGSLMTAVFNSKDLTGILFKEGKYYYKKNPELYARWVNFRAEGLTAFLSKTIEKVLMPQVSNLSVLALQDS